MKMSYEMQTMIKGVNLGKKIYNCVYLMLSELDDHAKAVKAKVSDKQVRRFMTYKDVDIIAESDSFNWVQVKRIK